MVKDQQYKERVGRTSRVSTSWLKSSRNALKGLKVSNARGGKEVFQKVFRHAVNKTRCFRTWFRAVTRQQLRTWSDSDHTKMHKLREVAVLGSVLIVKLNNLLFERTGSRHNPDGCHVPWCDRQWHACVDHDRWSGPGSNWVKSL